MISACFLGEPQIGFFGVKMHSVPPIFSDPRSAKIGKLIGKSEGKVGFSQIYFVEVVGGMVAEKWVDVEGNFSCCQCPDSHFQQVAMPLQNPESSD